VVVHGLVIVWPYMVQGIIKEGRFSVRELNGLRKGDGVLVWCIARGFYDAPVHFAPMDSVQGKTTLEEPCYI
jgi:hypothetical protein